MADVNNTSNDFEEYRRKMHPEQEEARPVVPTPKRAVSIGFGIFMVIVYVGVGILFLINFFNWDESFTVMRYILGVVLIIYGIYRCYRQFTNQG